MTYPMRRLKITVEYDGTDFHGWQRQQDVRTVQEDIEKALSRVLCEEVTLIGAGRTDTGVHALAQKAHFSTDNPLGSDRILKGGNSLLKNDVRIRTIEEVPVDFHARYSAVSRSYIYRLLRRERPLANRYAWYPGCTWDDELIVETVKTLPGEHSFKSFSRARPGEDEYICSVMEARWEYDAENAAFHITADRFMHRMVRGLVGALLDVGRGYLSQDEFRRLLSEPEENGATRVAQPQGLTLLEVRYRSD